MPSNGKMATVSTMIPMPPIHCVRLRQYRMPFDTPSISVRMDAPVVVMPDMVSKKALVTLGIAPLIRYGSIPKHTIVNQPKATMR